MQCANGDRRGSGCRERQLLPHDVVLPERDHEEDAEKSRARRDRNQPADVLLWQGGQQVQPVHSRDGADEQNANATGSWNGRKGSVRRMQL